MSCASYIHQRPTAQAARQYFEVAHTTQAKSSDPQARCCYPSKRCENLRALKRNGQLHRFCELRRAKANSNQRNLESRREASEMVELPPIDEYMQQLNEQYDLFVKEEQQRGELPPSDLLMRLDLDEDDLRVLAAVLSVDDEV
uniref:Uncharacterized protein n=1 Tax=Globisporangium ultimum (strain ATCC 200006 / CBS 805.95 / DAOM BR144) TaxID=431595 RepID=K3W7M9_GLOUD